MKPDKTYLSFSQRHGFEPVDIPFQLDNINDELRTDLWNAFYIHIHTPLANTDYGKESYRHIYKILWIHFFRKPFDDFSSNDYELATLIRKHIEKAIWYKVYNFFEFVLGNIQRSELYSIAEFINYLEDMLVRNHSAYRIINGKFVPITNTAEINEIKSTRANAETNNLTGIEVHLNSSVELLSKKPKPDLRNSIKESISMVEVICRIIEPSENTLGKALNKLGKNGKINPTLKAGFEKLYAFSNDKNGIRHALMDDENLKLEDAKFFLVSCSAFTNYLIEKANSENLLSNE